MTATLPSQERLLELFIYGPDTGLFIRRVQVNNRMAGSVAGTVGGGGGAYWSIIVDGHRYSAHRLAWKYIHGVDPVQHIDHINGNPRDNRLSNLREADQSQNLANRRKSISSTSPFKGVTRIKQKSRVAYSATVTARGVNHFVGNFATAEEASAAYLAKAKEVHGDFANVG